jgi:hypothetical protein
MTTTLRKFGMGKDATTTVKIKVSNRIVEDFLEIYEYLVADKVILKITIGYSHFSSDSEPEEL